MKSVFCLTLSLTSSFFLLGCEKKKDGESDNGAVQPPSGGDGNAAQGANQQGSNGKNNAAPQQSNQNQQSQQSNDHTVEPNQNNGVTSTGTSTINNDHVSVVTRGHGSYKVTTITEGDHVETVRHNNNHGVFVHNRNVILHQNDKVTWARFGSLQAAQVEYDNFKKEMKESKEKMNKDMKNMNEDMKRKQGKMNRDMRKMKRDMDRDMEMSSFAAMSSPTIDLCDGSCVRGTHYGQSVIEINGFSILSQGYGAYKITNINGKTQIKHNVDDSVSLNNGVVQIVRNDCVIWSQGFAAARGINIEGFGRGKTQEELAAKAAQKEAKQQSKQLEKEAKQLAKAAKKEEKQRLKAAGK